MRSKDAYGFVTGALPALVIAVLAGCSSGGGGPSGTGGSGTAGTVGTAGTSGTGTAGTSGTAGTTGTAGTIGAGGSATGDAGTTGSGATGGTGTGGAGATAGTGGTTGSGGTGGTGGGTAGRGGSTAGTGGQSGSSGRGGSGGAVGGTTGAGGAGGTGGASACPVITDFMTAWPSGKDPMTIGGKAVGAFKTYLSPMLPVTSSTYGGAGYALAFTWFGTLRFTKLTGDTTNNTYFIQQFEPYAAGTATVDNSATATVDSRAFGDLPLEIFQQNNDMRCKTIGLARADQQWVTAPNGITSDARYWADDMYMITALQVEAYRVTKDTKYLTRAATTLQSYATALQQTNGLFWHTRDSKPHWGRANGWVAAGTAELLIDLPSGSQRDAVLAIFKKQMDGLLPIQVSGGTDDGMWRQVLDLASSNPESSCTAMFTFALTTALKNGWLSGSSYSSAARRGWIAVANKTNANGQLDRVCPGTGAATTGQTLAQQQAFYANITLGSNDPHGQAPLLWAAHALLRADCPGMR